MSDKLDSMPSRAEIIAAQLAPYLKPRQSVLEIGAGKGLVAQELQRVTQANLTLVDVVDYNHTNLPLKVYDGETLPFDHGSFDYSLLIFVLHHTPEPLALVQEALRVSRGGVLIVENHVEGWLRKQVTRAIDSIPHYQYGVPICYCARTVDEWRKLLGELSVEVRELGRFHVDYFWQNVVLRVEPRE